MKWDGCKPDKGLIEKMSLLVGKSFFFFSGGTSQQGQSLFLKEFHEYFPQSIGFLYQLSFFAFVYCVKHNDPLCSGKWHGILTLKDPRLVITTSIRIFEYQIIYMLTLDSMYNSHSFVNKPSASFRIEFFSSKLLLLFFELSVPT